MNLGEKDIILIISAMQMVVVLAVGYAAYNYMLYRRRSLVFKLYAARDALIQCVAAQQISRHDPVFQIFYEEVVNLINVAHTDFFDLSAFLERARAVEVSDERKEFRKDLAGRIERQPLPVRQAIGLFGAAYADILVSKNLLLRILVSYTVVRQILSVSSYELLRILDRLGHGGRRLRRFVVRQIEYYNGLSHHYRDSQMLQRQVAP